jgi:hypothetical protein
VVAHTSVFIDGYLAAGSSYAVVDEEIAYVRHASLPTALFEAPDLARLRIIVCVLFDSFVAV